MLELKKQFANSDVEKLDEITNSQDWRKAFFNALKERNILIRNDIEIDESQYINSKILFIKALGFNESEKLGPACFITFHVNDNSVKLTLGNELSNEIKDLFSPF